MVGGRDRGDLVEDLLRALVGELLLIAHPGAEFADDLPVRLCLTRGILCFLPALDSPLGVRLGAVLLGVAGCREHHVGELGGLGQEDVLHDQELEVPEPLLDMLDVGVGEHRVLAHDVHRPDLTGVIGEDVHHLGDGIADPGLRDIVDPPGLHHLLPGFFVGDLLVTAEDVREATHVAGALHVVLAAERVHATAGLAQVAGEHHQVGGRFDVVDACGVLGDPHRVDEGGNLCPCDPLCSGPEALDRDAGDLRDVLKAVVLLHDDFLEFLVVLRPLCDELLILPAVPDDLLHQAV